jgi:hypothetical protein
MAVGVMVSAVIAKGEINFSSEKFLTKPQHFYSNPGKLSYLFIHVVDFGLHLLKE